MPASLPRAVTQAVQKSARALGLQVQRFRPGLAALPHLCPEPIRTVLDIGANTGQFAREARRFFPEAEIHSFEPLPEAYRACSRLCERDPRQFAYEIALADREGWAELHASTFSPSSSLLPMAALHRSAFPFAAAGRRVGVRLTTLDNWAAERRLAPGILLKLDVQGGEDKVLRGGARTLARAAVVVTEVSFAELYEGQLLFAPLQALLQGVGFVCAGFLDGSLSVHPQTRRPLQADAIFLPTGGAIPGGSDCGDER